MERPREEELGGEVLLLLNDGDFIFADRLRFPR